MFVTGPHDATQTSCLMGGNSHTGILHVLGVSSPRNTVGHGAIENIEFPSAQINSPEVKNECTTVSQSIFVVWRLYIQ